MPKKMTNAERADRLFEIKEQIEELMNEVEGIIRGTDCEQRARAYWYAQMRIALDDNHGYLGRNGCTMQDTCDELNENEEEEHEKVYQ